MDGGMDGMDVLDTARMKTGIREHARGLAEAVAGAEPSARVPTCPEWVLRDLVRHVGQTHRWTTRLIRTGAAGSAERSRHPLPDSPADWPGWLRAGAEGLVSAFDANPDGTVEHAVLRDRPTRRWLRRMMHETFVHHADAAFAVGAPYALAPDLAADALGELLDLLAAAAATGFRSDLAELRGDGETIAVLPVEPDEPGLLIVRTPDGLTCAADRDGGDATVSGPVQDLLLVFARRLPPDDARVKVSGDRALLDHWLARTMI